MHSHVWEYMECQMFFLWIIFKNLKNTALYLKYLFIYWIIKDVLDLTTCSINENEIKNGTIPCWECKLLISWEDKAVGIKILNIFILNLLFHIKGPKEISLQVTIITVLVILWKITKKLVVH